MNRREFLDRTKQTTLGLAVGMTILGDARSVRAAPANDKISLAIVGLGRGRNLGHGFLDRGDCRIVYACDVNRKLAASRAKEFAERQPVDPPKVEGDFRRALDDKSVDAVVVATPDHWHCPAAVWACQAGKDVYVEKPLGHNPWEGRKAVEAARKYKRIVQVGTQSRSAPYNFAAKRYLDAGKLGKVHLCRVFNQKSWPNFPPLPDSNPPADFDWDMWNGPAPDAPYNANYVGKWHHFWRYSGGDIINDGSHQLDLARWLMGVDYPKTVYSVGGRFNAEGAAETPDTQVAAFEFDNLLMTFELTLYTPYMLKTSPATRDSSSTGSGRRTGEALVDNGVVAREVVDFALRRQKEEAGSRKVGEILMEMGAVNARQLSQALRTQARPVEPAAKAGTDTSIRIDTTKLDSLIDAVSDLKVIRAIRLSNDVAAQTQPLLADYSRQATKPPPWAGPSRPSGAWSGPPASRLISPPSSTSDACSTPRSTAQTPATCGDASGS